MKMTLTDCRSLLLLCSFVFCALPLAAADQTPDWIWHKQDAAPADNEVRFFRKTFSVDGPVSKAVLSLAADNQATAFINGTRVAVNRSWDKPVHVDVTKEIKNGENLLAIRGQNESGEAAVVARLELTLPDKQKRSVVTDTTWTSSAAQSSQWFTAAFSAADWTQVVSRGKLGVEPWGNVLAPP